MSIFSPEPVDLQRIDISDLANVKDAIPRSKIASIKRVLSRDDDLKLVRSAMVERFGYIIGEVKDESTGTTTTTLERVKNLAIETAFNAGIYEITRSFAFDKIAGYNARMFGGDVYTYGDDADLADDMRIVRERGQAGLALQVADLYACGCGSSLLYISTEGDRICYDDVCADEFYVAFADEIVEKPDRRRPVNTLRLDEASVVALRLSSSGGKARWAAWFGASERLPSGRHVVYTASNWHEIPEVGDPTALEWSSVLLSYERGSRDVANPLTWHATHGGGPTTPTYPFVVLRGDPRGRGALLPTTGVSLYETMMEFDISSSILLRAANDGALGKRQLKRETGGDTMIPSTLSDLTVILGRGQSLENIGWSPDNAAKAQEVILSQMRQVAEAHHVPGFLLVTDWSMWPSGTALRAARRDMDEYRYARIALNRSSVSRLFDVERALINASGDSISEDVEQTWTPGDPNWSEDPLERLAVAQGMLQAGAINVVGFAREMEGLETIEQALAFVEEQRGADEETQARIAAVTPAAPKGFAGMAEKLGGF